MRSAPVARRPLVAAGAVTCAAVVGICGELSLGALLAVVAAGTVVAGCCLIRRAGAGAPAVGGGGLPWLGWLAAALCWEMVARVDDALPTARDLADPLLAHPLLRGAVTLGWLAVGGWLLARPSSRPEAS